MQIVGQVRGTRSGFAFLSPEGGGEDLFIPAASLGGALHGDRVRATVVQRGPYDFRPEAQVEEILERPNPLFTGNVGRIARTWFVQPDSPLLPERLRLRLGPADGVPGVKILFRVENLPDKTHAPVAIFEEAIGDEEDARLDPLVIATEYALPLRFSDAALAEAEARTGTARDPEDARREDFRQQFVLTIDPVDAKDFDDAVAIERLDGGGRLLTVHIADVSFYVPEGGALDREAGKRGTSVYFPGSAVPMLPEAISTVAASLAPDADKRVLTVRMRFDSEGELRESSVARGWMRSRARLHYGQAQQILEGAIAADDPLRQALLDMRDLARLLRRRRFRDGGFDLEVPEAEMTLGPDGVPTRIYRHRNLESNQLIEEFMIAANRAVGEWARERGTPFLFRVHQEPDAAALARFEETALTLLPGTSVSDLSTVAGLRRWLRQLPANPLTRIIHRFFLQSMKKAVYSPVDLGHFGLGVRGYCHFTSPIRRYPDLFNHRRVKDLLDARNAESDWEAARLFADHSSRREVNAEEAEREMRRLKSVRYLERHLGEEGAGHITGLLPGGIFVELDEIPVEGFIPRETLPAGLRFQGERMAWSEARSGWELRPGDAVRVQIVRCDLRARRIEMGLVRREPARRRSRRDSGAAIEEPGRAGRAGGRRRTRAETRGGRRARGGRGSGGTPTRGGRGGSRGSGKGPPRRGPRPGGAVRPGKGAKRKGRGRRSV